MSKWNKNKFSIYKSEEKTVLGLIKELGDQTNYNTDEVEKVKESNNKKVSYDDMVNIYKLDENDLPQLVYVKTGEQVGHNWIINEGLQKGDRIITEGLQKVVPGKPVKIVSEEEMQKIKTEKITK